MVAKYNIAESANLIIQAKFLLDPFQTTKAPDFPEVPLLLPENLHFHVHQ